MVGREVLLLQPQVTSSSEVLEYSTFRVSIGGFSIKKDTGFGRVMCKANPKRNSSLHLRRKVDICLLIRGETCLFPGKGEQHGTVRKSEWLVVASGGEDSSRQVLDLILPPKIFYLGKTTDVSLYAFYDPLKIGH